MLGLLHTWRHGIDGTLELHGQTIHLEAESMLIHVGLPVQPDGRVGRYAWWVLLNTDDLVILDCNDTCKIPTHKY